jgi:site-specific DNA-methyltransferase (adenine-specific)
VADPAHKQKTNAPVLLRRFKKGVRAEIYVGDALEFLKKLPDSIADLVFLDPPFNLGKAYGRNASDHRSDSEYRKWMKSVLNESVRVLAKGGALYLYHLPAWAVEFGAHLRPKLSFRHWIAIAMKNGFVRGRRLYPAHYSLLFYTKGTPRIFHRPRMPIDYCKCGRPRKSYGGYLPIVERKGINLSDVWDDVSPVRHRSRKRRRANELPSRITERVIAISGRKNLLFVDPFAGGGSAVLAAARAGMRVKACDLVRANARIQVSQLETLVASAEAK